MNVSGVGGAASLPVPVPPSSAAATTGGGTSSGTGEVRLPGQQRTTSESNQTKHKELPKPEPMPPLRGLTVAEFRAMLGVAPLPGESEAAEAGLKSSQIGGFDRYA